MIQCIITVIAVSAVSNGFLVTIAIVIIAIAFCGQTIVRSQSKFVLNHIGGAILKQPLRQLIKFVRNRKVCWSLTGHVLSIGVGSLGHQILRDLHVAVLTCQRQHGVAMLIGLIDMERESFISVDVHCAVIQNIIALYNITMHMKIYLVR